MVVGLHVSLLVYSTGKLWVYCHSCLLISIGEKNSFLSKNSVHDCLQIIVLISIRLYLIWLRLYLLRLTLWIWSFMILNSSKIIQKTRSICKKNVRRMTTKLLEISKYKMIIFHLIDIIFRENPLQYFLFFYPIELNILVNVIKSIQTKKMSQPICSFYSGTTVKYNYYDLYIIILLGLVSKQSAVSTNSMYFVVEKIVMTSGYLHLHDTHCKSVTFFEQ